MNSENRKREYNGGRDFQPLSIGYLLFSTYPSFTHLELLARAAITSSTNWVAQTTDMFLSHGSGIWKLKTKMSAGWVLCEALRENLAQASLPASGSFGFRHS